MSETTIVCEQNGPYCVSGTFIVKDAQGNEVDCLDKTPCTSAAVAIQPISPSAMGAMRSEGLRADVAQRYDRLPATSCRPWRRPGGNVLPCEAVHDRC